MARRGIIGFSGFGDNGDAESCPEGQYGVPPYCFDPSPWLPGGADAGDLSWGQCPEGQVVNPMTGECTVVPEIPTTQCPEGQIIDPMTGSCMVIPPIPITQCPEGQIINPVTSECMPIPGIPGQTAPVQCPSGQLLDTSTNTCVVVPQQQQQQVAPVEQKSWWQQRSDTEKGLIIGASVLGGIALVVVIKRLATRSYAENEGEVAAAVAEEKAAAEAAPTATPNKRYMTKAEAERIWRREILPGVKKRYESSGRIDKPARRESWGIFIDALHKDHVITRRQYDAWAHPKRMYKWNCATPNESYEGVEFSIPNLRPTVKRTKQGVPVVRGKRWGHASPPKHYRKMGASRPSDYAYPERFMFPLYFRESSGKLNMSKSRRHVANAKTRFSTYKHRYPTAIRQTIARNINKAARRVGLAADVRP